MAKKKLKRSPKIHHKRPKSLWKILWISVGIYACIMAVLTSVDIYFSHHTDVLAATTSIQGGGSNNVTRHQVPNPAPPKIPNLLHAFPVDATNPCYNAKKGNGYYCSGYWEVKGKKDTVYDCECPGPGHQKTCPHRVVAVSSSCGTNKCIYNPGGSDYCKKTTVKTSYTQPTPKITLTQFTPSCNDSTSFKINVAWKTSNFAKNDNDSFIVNISQYSNRNFIIPMPPFKGDAYATTFSNNFAKYGDKLYVSVYDVNKHIEGTGTYTFTLRCVYSTHPQ